MTIAKPDGPDEFSMSNQNSNSNLPEGWESIALKDFVIYKKGKKPNKLNDALWQSAVPYIDIKAFETGNVRRYADMESSVLVDRGDVLVVWDGARCGHVGKAPFHGALGSTLMTIKPIQVHSDYLMDFLRLSYEIINSNPRGTGIPHVEPDLFWNLKLPLAPLAEQKRIVAKVKELLALVNSICERLSKVSKILKLFRQAVLAAACSGQLTADWREKNQHCNSAQTLLNNILSKRFDRFKENNSGRYSKPIEPEILFELDIPDNWTIGSLDQLTCLITSGSRGWAKYYSNSGPIFIRAQNINTDKLELNKVAHVRPPDNAEGQRTRVQYGDILITITGANVTKTALIDSEISEAYVNQHVALIRPVDASIRNFLFLWTISPNHGRKKLLSDAYGAGKPGLNLSNIKSMPVGIPPLDEQLEIELRVEALFKFSDQIEERYEKAKAHLDKLTQSILVKAFRGELAFQDPNDLPAWKLLYRIKKEKSEKQAEMKNIRKRKNKLRAETK
ncbi:MAG: restriction endonuclease subunit S [Planctomycetota bacterium]|jgi:type I restriction enzyme S subunit